MFVGSSFVCKFEIFGVGGKNVIVSSCEFWVNSCESIVVCIVWECGKDMGSWFGWLSGFEGGGVGKRYFDLKVYYCWYKNFSGFFFKCCYWVLGCRLEDIEGYMLCFFNVVGWGWVNVGLWGVVKVFRVGCFCIF